jgi:hypothetical protein
MPLKFRGDAWHTCHCCWPTQVASLQQALKSRGLPKQVAAMIEAARPAAEDTLAVQVAQKRVADLQDQMRTKVGAAPLPLSLLLLLCQVGDRHTEMALYLIFAP